jgi:hypothetical protein
LYVESYKKSLAAYYKNKAKHLGILKVKIEKKEKVKKQKSAY